MAKEYLKPMLDVGSPRVLNCNIITRRVLSQSPDAKTFFRCRPLNNLVLIKDNDPTAPKNSTVSIGTKLYLPFNENDIYEGGRTIFLHDKNIEGALVEIFGEGAVPKELLSEDMRILRLLEKMPSLDPFLLKDVFLNEKIEMNPDYFEVSPELWNQIEAYILEGFAPLAKAAFPDALSSSDISRKMIATIWEGRDLETLRPLIQAFRLPPGQELEIFSAWKGVNFYGFQRQRMAPMIKEMTDWIAEIKIPVAAVSSAERAEIKATLETAKTLMQNDWGTVERILQEYQSSYDKMFAQGGSSNDFINFLKYSNRSYWILGNCLGKAGHASYCWDVMSKRFPGRKMAWEQLREFVTLIGRIYPAEKKIAQGGAW